MSDLTAGEHHPNCYQRTGVPDDLPDNLCDCRVLRMLDAATPDAGDGRLHGCVGCGAELDGDDPRDRCEDCEPDAGDASEPPSV